MRRVIAVGFVATTISGCNSYDVQVFGAFDKSERTMTVPAGGAGIVGAIKSRLVRDGWTLTVIGRGPTVTESSPSGAGRVEQFDTFNTRYKLLLEYGFVINSISRGGDVYEYDLSVVDTKTGSEVITMSGEGAIGTIAEKFIAAIRENTE